MANIRKATSGNTIEKNISCFPLYFVGRQPRAITSNPWAYISDYISDRLKAVQKRRVLAYVDQAEEFFEAARTYAKRSRPLLYYYSYLNLAKAVLITKEINLPISAHHGISDSRINAKEKLHLTGQEISINKKSSIGAEIFPELATVLNGSHLIGESHKVIFWLGWVPSIHRTYSEVLNYTECLLPVDSIKLKYDEGKVWACIYFKKGDADKEVLRKSLTKSKEFKNVFEQVDGTEENKECYCYESVKEKGKTRAIDIALNKLAGKIRAIGVSGILTTAGYKFYFGYSESDPFVPGTLATYGSMFYLGSLVRYKPHDFDTLLGGKYRWLIEEFLDTEPSQFVYQMAAFLSGRDVVRPMALKM